MWIFYYLGSRHCNFCVLQSEMCTVWIKVRHRVNFLKMKGGERDRNFIQLSLRSHPAYTLLFYWHSSMDIDLVQDCDPEQVEWEREIHSWIDCMEKGEDCFLKGWVLVPLFNVELMWAFKGTFLHDAGEWDTFWWQMYVWFKILPYRELPLYTWM